MKPNFSEPLQSHHPMTEFELKLEVTANRAGAIEALVRHAGPTESQRKRGFW
jgi:hypothetical protein